MLVCTRVFTTSHQIPIVIILDNNNEDNYVQTCRSR